MRKVIWIYILVLLGTLPKLSFSDQQQFHSVSKSSTETRRPVAKDYYNGGCYFKITKVEIPEGKKVFSLAYKRRSSGIVAEAKMDQVIEADELDNFVGKKVEIRPEDIYSGRPVMGFSLAVGRKGNHFWSRFWGPSFHYFTLHSSAFKERTSHTISLTTWDWRGHRYSLIMEVGCGGLR